MVKNEALLQRYFYYDYCIIIIIIVVINKLWHELTVRAKANSRAKTNC